MSSNIFVQDLLISKKKFEVLLLGRSLDESQKTVVKQD